MIDILLVWLKLAGCVLIIAGGVWLVIQKVLLPYKLKSYNESFIELLDVLNAVIATELKLYDDNILQNRPTITNSNFENYLTDVSLRIGNQLSDEFYVRASHYVSSKMINELITRTVSNWLMNKVTSSIE